MIVPIIQGANFLIIWPPPPCCPARTIPMASTIKATSRIAFTHDDWKSSRILSAQLSSSTIESPLEAANVGMTQSAKTAAIVQIFLDAHVFFKDLKKLDFICFSCENLVKMKSVFIACSLLFLQSICFQNLIYYRAVTGRFKVNQKLHALCNVRQFSGNNFPQQIFDSGNHGKTAVGVDCACISCMSGVPCFKNLVRYISVAKLSKDDS